MTHSTRTILLAQLFISCMMAALMTGIFGFAKLGATQAFMQQWRQSFIVAWPIAFMLSLVVGPIAFKLAYQVNRLLP
ncbi:MAG: 50S ribosomal protein L1 [uncultured bacterium]|nr:MAG: 50S ribosomal protein L1 [uncultured bacterium]